jgi:hypothetical protein
MPAPDIYNSPRLILPSDSMIVPERPDARPLGRPTVNQPDGARFGPAEALTSAVGARDSENQDIR